MKILPFSILSAFTLLAAGCELVGDMGFTTTATLNPEAIQISEVQRLGADNIARWSNAETVIAGTVSEIFPGIAAMSYPPILHVKINLKGLEVLTGSVDAPEKIPFIWRGDTLPFAVGDQVILTGASEGFTDASKIDSTDLSVARKLLTQTAPGWTITADGKLKSPWANPANRAVSPITSPALVLTAKQIIPPNAKPFENPYGDGEFKLILTNTGTETVTIEPLRQLNNQILWDESVVAVSGNIPFVFDVPMPSGTTPVSLKPGESVSGSINTLLLRDLNWPNGGSRVHFLFAIGQAKSQGFFYYYSKTHDPLRQSIQK